MSYIGQAFRDGRELAEMDRRVRAGDAAAMEAVSHWSAQEFQSKLLVQPVAVLVTFACIAALCLAWRLNWPVQFLLISTIVLQQVTDSWSNYITKRRKLALSALIVDPAWINYIIQFDSFDKTEIQKRLDAPGAREAFELSKLAENSLRKRLARYAEGVDDAFHFTPDGGPLMCELLADYGREAKSGEVLNALAGQQITRFSPEVATRIQELSARFSDRMQEPTTYASRPGAEPA